MTFYIIFLIAKLARLATLNSLSSLFHDSLTLLSLTSRHSLPSSSAQKFVIRTHIRVHTFSVLNARPSYKQSQAPGLTFFTVYGTPLETFAIVGHWREFWALLYIFLFNFEFFQFSVGRNFVHEVEYLRKHKIGSFDL